MRQPHLIVLFAILTGLAACNSVPTQQSTSQSASEETAQKKLKLENALQLQDDGKFGDAAQVMLQISHGANGDEQTRYLFDAAQLYLAASDKQHTKDILKGLLGTAPNSSFTQILNAQILLLDKQSEAAIAALGAIARTDTSAVTKGIFWLTLAQADESCITADTTSSQVTVNSCLAGSLEARAEANDVLTSPDELAKNQAALWQMLSAQSPAILHAVKNQSKSATLKAWIDLALIAKETDHRNRDKKINEWELQYPNQAVLNQRLLELRGVDIEKMRHVAVILPTKSKDLGSAAKAVWLGFQTAQKNVADSLPVKLYEADSNPATTLKAYQLALDHGACIVIGPLARNSLTLLEQKRVLPVPTIFLNVIEEGKAPINLYQFDLPTRQEVRVIVRGALAKGFKDTIILRGDNPLDMPTAEAFVNEWARSNHAIKTAASINNITGIQQLTASSDPASTMLFIAADFQSALPAIKAIPPSWTVFGTSALNNNGQDTAQLSNKQNIYFVDASDAAGRKMAGSTAKMDATSTRLYALGSDAYRLALLMLHEKIQANRPLLDGDSGKLHVTRDGMVERDLILSSLQHSKP